MARRLADWGNLPKELATKIAEHIDWYEDFESFGWVCSGWRWATKEAKLRACVVHDKSSSLSWHHKHRLPWLLLPGRNRKSFRRRFYSLSKGMVRHINLPNPLSDEDYKKLGGIKLLSSHGWLLMVAYNGTNNPYLLDPLSGTTIELPRICYQRRLGGDEILYFVDKGAKNIKKCVLSANPSMTSDFTVFLSAADTIEFGGCQRFIVSWRNGDNEWTTVGADNLPWNPHDIAYYQGHFYGVLYNRDIVKFETTKGHHIHKIGTFGKTAVGDHYYLVESAGQLLVIQRMNRSVYNFSPNNFKVFEFDFDIKEVKQVQSLGNRSIFTGLNSSFSLDVTLAPGFKPNCIYHSEDGWFYDRGTNYWVYNLKDGKIESYYVDSMEVYCDLTWFTWVESW